MIQNEDLARRLRPLARTVDALFPEEEMLERLASGRPLRCKLGIDPTSPTVHVGNGVQLWNLKRLQEMGHVPVLILGDYTATVGDPSGKDKTRPLLTGEQVEENLRTYLDQISNIIDVDRAEIRRNSEWFSKMSFLDVLALTNRMTVQQMLERDSFEKRMKGGEPISVREFVYCFMQGWDSVEVKADIELGGTDQTFNLTVGRRLMSQEGLAPQVCLVGPLLEGTDGQEKMSKSLGNAIGVCDEPRDVFGRAMRVSDELMGKYMRLATDLEDAEITTLLGGDPMEAKLALAAAMVARYHGPEAGTAEREEFLRVFRHRAAPTEVEEKAIGAPGEDGLYWIVDLLKHCAFAKSTGDARRLVEGGGVYLAEQRIEDWRARLAVAGGEVLRVGRRRQARVTR